MPPPEDADDRGLVAVGGDLRSERLIDAYRRGIFPWYSEGLPILWHSPDPRFVLEPADLRINRSLRKTMRRRPYRVTLDRDFSGVIRACADIPRPEQDGTWITEEMIQAYEALARLGYAHSVESWAEGELVGGIYGVAVGSVFCGESMFSLAPDASKVAFVSLVQQLEAWGCQLVDCQVHTQHLERFGARDWSRADFLTALAHFRERPLDHEGPWSFDGDERDIIGDTN